MGGFGIGTVFRPIRSCAAAQSPTGALCELRTPCVAYPVPLAPGLAYRSMWVKRPSARRRPVPPGLKESETRSQQAVQRIGARGKRHSRRSASSAGSLRSWPKWSRWDVLALDTNPDWSVRGRYRAALGGGHGVGRALGWSGRWPDSNAAPTGEAGCTRCRRR